MLNPHLLTPYAKNLDKTHPLFDYPRPQMVRNSYQCLNGIWKYAIGQNGTIPTTFEKQIVVPFPLESTLSEASDTLKENEFLFYQRDFNIEASFLKDKTILHFNAVDQICQVYLNNIYLGEHTGGYLPFEFNITSALHIGKNTLTVKVQDALSYDYPYGKQSKKRGGMWYTSISGIWQTVWMESVKEDYIKNIIITPNIDEQIVTIIATSNTDKVKIVVKDMGKVIYQETSTTKLFHVKIANMKLWSPEHPFLYTFELFTKGDHIQSYFAMRKFSKNEKSLLLNNHPYFINGLLDQGYFSDGIYTPASYLAYRDDILKMKSLGFNTLRKHIKIEPMLFYYYCDTLGMIVLQDMVNAGKYSFIKDTVLPTIGIKRKLFETSTILQKEHFIDSCKDTIDYLYNVCSIAYYTIFNEGWGQFEADKLYSLLQPLDPTRIMDTTSGWFHETLSDVNSLHVYFKPIILKPSTKPTIVSEFGGYVFKIKEHSYNQDKTFGYKLFKTQEEFEEGLITLYEKEIYGNLKNGLAGAIYTQVSDVEDETNGLLTYDRVVLKVHPEKIKPIMDKICGGNHHE